MDIAAKIAASQKKMKEKEEATKRQEDQEPKDTSGWVFKRVVSDPGPQSAHAFGANLTIFDAVKMGDVLPPSPCLQIDVFGDGGAGIM